MHNSRLFALVGVGIGVIGLFLKALTTAGEGLLPTLSQTGAAFPDGIPTIWGGLATWAQILLVLATGAIVTLSLRPRHEDAFDRTSGGIVAVLGIATLTYAVAEWADAFDKADALEAAFVQAAQQGVIPAAFSVAPSTGFVILLVGTALIVFGGVLGFRIGDQDSFF